MTKQQLIDHLAQSKGISRQTAKLVVTIFFQSITDTLMKGGRVEIRDFGIFSVRHYDGRTGKEFRARIFMAPVFYQRLKWMVDDKAHARATGAVSILTRQPAEGRSAEGGLRFGEMERDCLIAHGSAALLVERMCKNSDRYRTTICRLCGLIGIYDGESFECKSCDNTSEFAHVEIPYAFKLLIQEMMSINLAIRLRFRISS